MPAIYIPHGGGPLPLLNDPTHRVLSQALSQLPERLPRPRAILMVSAHWEAARPTVQAIEKPGMLYDYYGFPPEAYRYQYPAPGSPVLARAIVNTLEDAGIMADQDFERGFDHGCFVPLMLMYPGAKIPVVQLSLCNTLDPETHIKIGEALGPLVNQDLLVIGSGSSFHNMAFQPNADSLEKARQFDDWLNQQLLDGQQTAQALRNAMQNWQAAPEALFAHPREEHLLPLHVCLGIALAKGWQASRMFAQPVFPVSMSGFLWGQAG